jgi:4a-hydroxytetrahydrobiopterin dehydratase
VFVFRLDMLSILEYIYLLMYCLMPWEEKDNALIKTYVFHDFPTALSWMVQCSFVIEHVGHHPEWTNVYNTVRVKLTTHDAGGVVTEKDMELSRLLDKEYMKLTENYDEYDE